MTVAVSAAVTPAPLIELDRACVIRGQVRVLRDFRLSAGQASDVLHLPPGFRYCLSHDARPVAPACANV